MEAIHPDIQSLADSAESFAKTWLHRSGIGRWRIAVGNVGCGKTHISRRLKRWAENARITAWEMAWSGPKLPTVIFSEWMELASPETCDERQFDDWIREVSEASMVILDDIGTETDQYKTGIPTARLCRLLNRCEGKWLWISTNIQPMQWATKWDARVEDRLLSGKIITINAPSYRSEKD